MDAPATDADRILDETPATGSLAEVSPRINARLLPVNGSHGLSAKTLSEAIALTQAVVQYAGNDVCHGLNPDFADLRSLSPEVVGLTKLTVEPFEEGQLRHPHPAGGEPAHGQEAEETRDGHGRGRGPAVRHRSSTACGTSSSAAQVSIGAIQVVESLGRVIRREAEAIEFSSFDALGQPSGSLRVDEEYIGRVNQGPAVCAVRRGPPWRRWKGRSRRSTSGKGSCSSASRATSGESPGISP